MARTFYQPNYVTDKRFSPSGFMPSPVAGPSIEEQNVAANKPAAGANPLQKLNTILGTNIGAPYQGSAVRQLTDSMPSGVQVAGALGEQQDQQRAAQFAQAMAERGGMPVPGNPYFNEQSKVAAHVYEQIYGQRQPTAGLGAFGQPSSTYAPTGLRDRAIAANGAEVAGTGGVMVSAGRNAQGGNSFMLRSDPKPSSFLPAGQPVGAAAPTATPSGPSALEQAQGQYRDALQAATAPKETDRYSRTGPMSSKDGLYIGDGVFDKKTGRTGMMGPNGEFQALPPGTEPITATGLTKSIPDQKQFRAIKGELTDAEISLKNMDRYIKSVGGSAKGVDRLATQFVTGIKTLTGQGLNPKEIATRMAQGQMQGLLGANRTNVVGGGVMTEQDALRIIQRLGGDVNALQNPEIVRRAIGEVYSDRFMQYQDSLRFYNAAVGDFYGARGFKPADEVKFSESFKFEEPAPAGPAAIAQSGLSPEKEARRQELRAKLNKK